MLEPLEFVSGECSTNFFHLVFQEEGLHVAINSVLLLVLLVEFVVAIFQATVCCKAVCSCCKPYDEVRFPP